MTDKVNGHEYINIVCECVHNHPDIKPEDRRKWILKLLEPMIEELFGSEWEKPEILGNDFVKPKEKED